jgi:hypothetical protein
MSARFALDDVLIRASQCKSRSRGTIKKDFPVLHASLPRPASIREHGVTAAWR